MQQSNWERTSRAFSAKHQQQEVYPTFKTQLADLRRRMDPVVATDLANFNRMLREQNMGM